MGAGDNVLSHTRSQHQPWTLSSISQYVVLGLGMIRSGSRDCLLFSVTCNGNCSNALSLQIQVKSLVAQVGLHSTIDQTYKYL